jgi:drug/metabolite transporter (DMT)-like permease
MTVPLLLPFGMRNDDNVIAARSVTQGGSAKRGAARGGREAAGGAEREAASGPRRGIALTSGTVTAALGILCFSFTFPATRLADPDFGGTIVGLGRAVGATLLAIAYLALTDGPRPRGRQWIRVAVAAAGVVVGFPLLTALALRHVTAAHTAVIVGLLPAATALVGALRGGERPSRAFWLAALGGLVAVLAFAAIQGAGGPTANDGLVILAVFVCAGGYAEGGILARQLGGARTICWALLVAAPVTAPIAIATALHHGMHADVDAWLGFAYVSVGSMFLGFVAWYHGLAHGGIARMSQLQLAQPLLTLAWSAALLGEHVTPVTLVAALAVLACVAATQRARVAH